jgi:hypothetical protein
MRLGGIRYMSKRVYTILNKTGLYVEEKGNVGQIREWIEKQLAHHLGFFVMLDIDEDDDFKVFLHADHVNQLDKDQLLHLKNLGLNDQDSTEFICKLLNIWITYSYLKE